MNLIQQLLAQIQALPVAAQWALFFVENLLLTVFVLITGEWIIKARLSFSLLKSYSFNDWRICIVTNVLNTVVTFAGFWLWEHQYLVISYQTGWRVVADFLLLFFAMDLLMYLFHFIIHKTALYNWVHQLHHQSVDPEPIDLFVLHPVETIGFGMLWLMVLLLYNFNAYAVVIYLSVNLLYGMIGHLGTTPLNRIANRYLATKLLYISAFHHDHHKHVESNYGFYTSIWDRLFGTLKK